MLDAGFRDFIKKFSKNGCLYRTSDNLTFLRQLQAQLIKMRREPTNVSTAFYPDEHCEVWSVTSGLVSLSTYLNYHDSVATPNSGAEAPYERAQTLPAEILHKLMTEPRTTPRICVFLNVLQKLDPQAPLASSDTLTTARIIDLVNTNQHRSGPGHGVLPVITIFTGTNTNMPAELKPILSVFHDPGLSQDETSHIIDKFVSSIPDEIACEELEQGTEAELFGLSSTTVHNALQVSLTKSDQRVFFDPEKIRQFKMQAVRKSGNLELIPPTGAGLSALGGLDRFKSWVQVVAPSWTKDGQAAGLKPPKGVILLGVWGCGKSEAAKALAKEWKIPVVRIDMGKLRSVWMGASEQNLHGVLELIGGISPCIVWLDEAEKGMAGGTSNDSDSGVGARMLAILSTWLQETQKQVCLVSTVNSLGSFPAELVSRADELFFFDLPTTTERVEILKVQLVGNNQDPAMFDLNALAEASSDLVGREIQKAIPAAMRQCFFDHKTITPGLLQSQLQTELSRRPRLRRTMTREIGALIDWVSYDPIAKDGIRARFASSREDSRSGVTVEP